MTLFMSLMVNYQVRTYLDVLLLRLVM